MRKVITSDSDARLRVPIKLWLDDIEDGALAQAVNLANLPFVFRHVALMPDAHQGYGMPIGGVIATDYVVIPNAVGVDIGCGMRVMRTDIPVADMTQDKRKEIMSRIRAVIPLGIRHHQHPQDMPGYLNLTHGQLYVVGKEYESAKRQIGTLGGGNHFIEIQAGNDGFVYVMLHSGSRNLGKQVGDFYNKVAAQLNERWHSRVTPDMQLAFLPMETEESKHYIDEMLYCVNFARANRKMMMDRIADIIVEVFPNSGFQNIGKLDTPVFDVPHNYARLENHFGQNVMVHRKGATFAGAGSYGIIPGSQGTASYIVLGKGNPDSYNSCSHGAGRKMGRKEAQRTLDLSTEIKRLEELGIVHSIRTTDDLDEATGAYKDIDVVMENQKDLVDILIELKPLAVIKDSEKTEKNRRREKKTKNAEDTE